MGGLSLRQTINREVPWVEEGELFPIWIGVAARGIARDLGTAIIFISKHDVADLDRCLVNRGMDRAIHRKFAGTQVPRRDFDEFHQTLIGELTRFDLMKTQPRFQLTRLLIVTEQGAGHEQKRGKTEEDAADDKSDHDVTCKICAAARSASKDGSMVSINKVCHVSGPCD